jgi:hypothetical protein
MFNTYCKVLVIAGLVFCLFSSVFAYSGGSGTEADPYQIATVSDWQQLMNTSSHWNKHFILTADVNLQGVALIPVGEGWPDFNGIFDGNGHIIRNADINMPHSWAVGLFGYSNGQIRNLGVVDVNISGYGAIGGLVGLNDGSISNCYSTGIVSGSSCVGGLVGSNGNDGNGSITNCYSTGAVSGSFCVGGLAGLNYDGGSISNCYSTGAVSGSSWCVGGLVGFNGSSIFGSFWDTQTSGQSTSAGGTGKTTAEMKTMSTFTDAGWDFVEIWGIGENQTYPYLRTEPAGDLNHDKKVDFEDFAIFASHWLENWAGSSIGLVAYYPFNGNANDASGNGNNGTVVGAAFETYGAGNTMALHFNGNTSSYVVVPRSASLEPVDAISISMWVKGVPGQACGYGWGTILRKADDCQPGYFIKGCNGGTSFMLCGANPCWGEYWTAGFLPFTGTNWQYIVGTYSRTDGSMKSYEDGVLVNQTPLASQLLHTGNLYIGGADVCGDDGGFNGLINEVQIYNRALSASEVQQLYLSGSGSHP